MLADGGNAVDAALAMTAMSWLALPGQCGIGGDFFAVVREPDGRVWTVNGSGFGPDGASAEGYLDRGMTAVPADRAAGGHRSRGDQRARHPARHGRHPGAGRAVEPGGRGGPHGHAVHR